MKNIIFDMGGVLVDLDRRRCVEAFTDIGFPQADAMIGIYGSSGVFGELEAGTITPEGFYEYVRRETGRAALKDSDIAAALNSFIVGLPVYKLQMLLDLRQRFRIYLLSNTNAIMMPYIRRTCFERLTGFAFDDYFDRAFLSYEMGLVKPDEEIFLRMMNEGEIAPAESLFIDDGPANIDTAARLGFHTLLTQPEEDFRARVRVLLPAG
ncbi:MAG: HAD family phosphatase [Rikenellaceae bacterium]|nr:HAD family phosphatase [Rikenellaceae bacterium]MCL2691957.1 HAD family phosphatase [Rikenellaceae bacterium]